VEQNDIEGILLHFSLLREKVDVDKQYKDILSVISNTT
jgi:hypothetical protein